MDLSLWQCSTRWKITLTMHRPLFEVRVENSAWEAFATDTNSLQYTITLKLMQNQEGIQLNWKYHTLKIETWKQINSLFDLIFFLCWRYSYIRDGPFLCTYFKNLNNVRISADPPTHPQIRTTRKRKICTPEQPPYYLHRMYKCHGFLRLV